MLNGERYGLDRSEKANIEDRGGQLHQHRRAGGLQGHCGADARQDQLRHHPQRAGRSGGNGLSGAASHLGGTRAVRQGLPPVRQRADGAQGPVSRGDGQNQQRPVRPDEAGGSGHQSGGPDGVQLCGVSHLYGGGPPDRRHGAALRADRRGRRQLHRRGDAVGQSGEEPADAAGSAGGGGDAASAEPPAEHAFHRRGTGKDERHPHEPQRAGDGTVVPAAEPCHRVRLLPVGGIPAPTGVHQRCQPASEVSGVPGHRQGPRSHELHGGQQGGPAGAPERRAHANPHRAGKCQRRPEGEQRGHRQLRHRRQYARPRGRGGTHPYGLCRRGGAAQLLCREPEPDVW